MVPIKVTVPLTRLALANKSSDSHSHISDIEAFEERRHNAKNRWLSCMKKRSKAYNKKVRPRSSAVGDLVLKVAGHVQKGLKAQNLSRNTKDPMSSTGPMALFTS